MPAAAAFASSAPTRFVLARRGGRSDVLERVAMLLLRAAGELALRTIGDGRGRRSSLVDVDQITLGSPG